MKQTNEYNKTETDSEILRTDRWLPEGRVVSGRGKMGGED